ncbi:MAG: AraC family transcriptional regulator [Phenylobacterium sp.]|nr:MAG: AraC family transcriptional regulator [Phenylobacterium sp.]
MGPPDWRIGEARAAIAPEGVTELSGDGWRGRFERMAFGPGFHMHLGRFDIHQPFEQPVVGADAGPALISVYVPICGRGRLQMLDWPELELEPGRAILFTAKERRSVFRRPAPQTFRFFSVALVPSLMIELLDRRIPEPLAALIESNGRETVVKERFLSAATRGLIDGLGEPGEAGALQRLHREAVAIRLLTEMVEGELAEVPEVAEAAEAPPLSPREELAVRAAAERLLADLRDTPSAASLAEAAEIGLRRFLRAFEAIHGASPAQLLRRERLVEGRRLLEQGGMPLKAIAWQVGYGHVSNFVAAFSEHYGAPPRRFSRQRLVAE